MTLAANWSYPTSVRFGAGRIEGLADACRVAGITRPLFVTDRGLAALAITTGAVDRLDGAGLRPAIFSDVDANPNEANLSAGIDAFVAGAHDGVVAFGGGSALDLGKLVAFAAGQTRPIWDFEDVGDHWTRADADAIAPVVAVPTTAGTGSEFGRAGVLTNSATHEKKIIFHPKILPAVVIADPELTIGLPPAMTAGTGMDAFAHCFEALSSPHFHPMSHGIALEGLRLVNAYLPRAYADGGDLEARAHLLAAAGMGAVAFQKGLGAVHALSHPIGALYNTHHGTTNAVVLPGVIDFNHAAIRETMDHAATYVGVASGLDGLRARVVELNEAFGFPSGLAAMGVEAGRLDEIAQMALRDPSVGGNPVPMTARNTRALLESVL